MDKLKKLKLLLKNPLRIINSGILAYMEKIYQNELIRTYDIDRLPTIDLLDLFPDLDEEIHTYSFLEGTALITDMILLKKLAARYNSCSYLEIGSWRGESLANISENASHITTINLPKEEMKKMNMKQEFIDLHGFFSKDIKNITEIYHNSKTYDFNNLDSKFDLIFIDGDHSYDGVLSDTKSTFQLRRNKNSIIVWHDYGFSTEKVRYSTLKAILDGIPSTCHKHLYHVSNTLCAVYFEDCDLPKKFTEFPSIPSKKFSVRVRGSRF